MPSRVVSLRGGLGVGIIVIGIALLVRPAVAQQSASAAGPQDVEKIPPISLRTRIPLPGVYGRIDHYGWDSKRGILIVSALGNNTVEIVDQWKRGHTITGLEHPQASVYVPGVDRIAVSSRSGKLRFYDAATYDLLKTLDFGAAANTDNMRYDAATRLLYVGYGERDRGALATLDPAAMERREEFRLGSHPESFQLESHGSKIFVNLPDQEAFGVVDRKSGVVTKWKVPGNANGHTLAFDEINHRLFTAALQPGRFTVVDSESGRLIAELPSVLGVDDLWFDALRKRIYATGAGAIDVFQQVSPDQYNRLARIPVGAGSGSTSLYLKTRTQDGLFMSWPNMLPQGGSEVLLFYVND
ncbi:MAG TPA: hypothetical protein VH684_15500 [Xanthobacteraceae bacterium]|jgi:hypothetical protein